MKNLILIFVGGGAGSCCRYLIAIWLNNPESNFPLGTFTANMLSCLVLGFTTVLVLNSIDISDELRFLIMVGFCGGFSTFSTFDNEILSLVKNEKYLSGLFYALISIFIGLLSLIAGISLARKLL
ncbi:MAG: fluoride efflux transporter CrcB [Bacteroidota bacterium]